MILSKLSLAFHNARSWKSKKKYVVIESDDWGSVRMSSKAAKDDLKSKGYPIADCAFNSFDMLESQTDLEYLFQVLDSVKGCDGLPAILTANNIVANPDFDRIRDSDYQDYHYETFITTLNRYYPEQDVFGTYKIGINSNWIMPQFHGREHVNLYSWFENLACEDKSTYDAFAHRMFSITHGKISDCRRELLNAFEIFSDYTHEISQSIDEGTNLFEQIWGFNSETCIAPCYIWDDRVEKMLSLQGVKTMQSGRAQIVPHRGGYVAKRRYTGERNKCEQKYTVRNVFFEPSTCQTTPWIENAMAQVKSAFMYNTPCIISTHRVNFMGGIDINNRQRGLELLSGLLHNIMLKYPDVHFISSARLSHLIHNQ